MVSNQATQPPHTNTKILATTCITMAKRESICFFGELRNDFTAMPNINMEKYPKAIVMGCREMRYLRLSAGVICLYLLSVAIG